MRKFSILINSYSNAVFATIPIVEDPSIPPNCCLFKSDKGEWLVDMYEGTIRKIIVEKENDDATSQA